MRSQRYQQERKELSVNKLLLEDITERFEESERRSKADNQKRQSYIENEKGKFKK